MTEQRISLETAKLAKEVGFNWKVQFYYNHKNTLSDDGANLANYNQEGLKTLSAPTQNFLQKWIREVHNLHIHIDTTPHFDEMESHRSKYKSLVKIPFQSYKWTTGKYYLGNTYEEVLESGIYEALLLIKTTENDK
ncbi:MAG TPA: hypothetical protein PKD00_00850 [Burkholderiales bacterium]|nr:hypothetical protein [Burkholderiales bacterium]